MNPKLIIIAGPNGSGKTTLTGQVLKHEWVEGCEYINPDNIARDEFGDWNSYESVMNAARRAEQLRNLNLDKRQSLIFETVLSSTEKVEYIKRAKAAGYFIRLFFVATDSPEINASRVARRVIEGGHDVPISKIISRYSKSIKNVSLLSKIVDRAYFYDNSIQNTEPVLLFRLVDGAIHKVYADVNDWAKPLLEIT